MNGMLLALTMLADTELTNRQREFTSIIEDSMSILLQVINDILDYSKLSSGSFSLISGIVDVEGVLGAVMRNCRSLLKPGVELTSTIPPNFPKTVEGDPLRYRLCKETTIIVQLVMTDGLSLWPFEYDPIDYSSS